MKKIPLSVQIQEVKTELAFRAQVFPRQIQQQPRKRAELEYRLEAMEAVLATLQWLYVHEEVVREFVAEKAKAEGTALEGLPLVSKEEGMKMRTGHPVPK